MATLCSLECLTSMYSTTSCIEDDMGSLDNIYTTATGLATSLSTIPEVNINIIATNNYLDSLSNEQLAKLDEMLKAKEATFTLANEELDDQISQKEKLLTVGTNTYKIDYSTNNNQVDKKAKTYQKTNQIVSQKNK